MREVWARARAAGVTDVEFWDSSPLDTALQMREFKAREGELQRAANFRTGMIVSVIANTTPSVKRRFKPIDFFPDLGSTSADTPDALRAALVGWAIENKGVTLA